MFNSARLELTGSCDIKCLYCHAGEKNSACYKDQEIPYQRWLEIILECKDLGVSNFILTGGEPFLYSRWPEIIRACGQNVRVIISTNGRHFSEKNIAILSELSQVKEFRTSIDGLATNDIIRDGSSYRESLETIARVKENFPDKKIMVQTVTYEQNLPEISDLYERLKKLGIYRWRLSQLWKTVRTEKNRNILNFSEYDKMFSLYADLIGKHQGDGKPFMFSIDNVYYSWIDKEDYAPMSLSGHPCSYNFGFLCVNANGDLVFCPALNLPFSSIKEQSIKEAIKNSKWLNDFKKITVDSLGCGNCRYIKICGGGCRADSQRWLGTTKAIDPNSCCMMPMIEKNILPLLGIGERTAFLSLINENGDFPVIYGRNVEEAAELFKRKEAVYGTEK